MPFTDFNCIIDFSSQEVVFSGKVKKAPIEQLRTQTDNILHFQIVNINEPGSNIHADFFRIQQCVCI